MNVQDERTATLHDRVETWREQHLIDADTQKAVEAQLKTPWRSHGVIVQAVFFVLTLVAMGAAYGFLHLFSIPGRGILAGIAFLPAAEFLIRVQRWFGTGVEAALWIGGLFGFISELPSSGKPEALLVVAAAFAIAGFRVRNPLFGAVAAICVMVYAETKWDVGVVAALVIATLAAVALLREWRRPSTEWLWILMAMALPVAGVFTADAKWRTMTIAVYAAYGALAFGLGLMKRHHALLLSGASGLVIAAVLAAERMDAPLETKLAAGGAFLLVTAFIAQRALRARTTGIVVTPASLTRVDEALAIAGALAAPTGTRVESSESRPQGEGGFGGAGATGDY
jgi:hypothetical protein